MGVLGVSQSWNEDKIDKSKDKDDNRIRKERYRAYINCDDLTGSTKLYSLKRYAQETNLVSSEMTLGELVTPKSLKNVVQMFSVLFFYLGKE